MAEYSCDLECGRQATLSVQDLQGGGVTFLCPLCYSLTAIELAKLQWPELLASPEPEPVPAPPAKRGGKKATVPPVDFDEHRTIIQVTEDRPRPPEYDQVDSAKVGQADPDGDLPRGDYPTRTDEESATA